jgi:hypothetical protein
MIQRKKISIGNIKFPNVLFRGFEKIKSEEYTFEYKPGMNKFFIYGFFRDSQTNIGRCMCEYIDMENTGILGDSVSLDVKWKKIY